MLIQLLEYLQSGKTYSVQELAELLHKDVGSIQVELEYLENQGYIRKVAYQADCNHNCNGCHGCDQPTPAALMSIYGKLLNEPNRRNKMKLYESGEDYLEAVLMLQKKNGMVRSVDLARHMEVSKPSVCHAVATLRDGGFLMMDEDRFLHLTDVGREVAEQIYEKHRFFTDRLIEAGVDPVTAEKDACRMEHVISQESFERLRDAYKTKKE